MSKKITTVTQKRKQTLDWINDVNSDLPSEIVEIKEGNASKSGLLTKRITLTVREYRKRKKTKFKVKLSDTLGEVFQRAAEALGKPLLPPQPNAPFDVFRCKKRRGGRWTKIKNFDEPLWLALLRGCKRHFSIKFKLTVKINTQWGLVPSKTITPRELLSAFGMSPEEFSLYKDENDAEPLPPDTPIEIKRGQCFEAQKDGRYGDNLQPQTIEEEVEKLETAGIKARLHLLNSQKYVEVNKLAIPSPPWGNSKADVLIAIPATYKTAGLDAFYLGLPMTHQSGAIPYQQSPINLNGRSWVLISWHYHPSRPWNQMQDNLESHIQHIRGFFLTRGVRK